MNAEWDEKRLERSRALEDTLIISDLIPQIEVSTRRNELKPRHNEVFL